MSREPNSSACFAPIARRFIWGLLALGICLPATAFAQNEKPEHALFLMNADGSNRRQLVDLEHYNAQGSPSFSPHGKMLAFDAWRAGQGESSSKAHIFIANADGSGAKDLGDGAMPSWSPDGKQIVFSRYTPNHGVWMMNPDGSNKAPIDNRGWCGQWSPDGKKIAYTVRHGGANFCIYDVKSQERRYLFEYDEDSEPYRMIQWNYCWSPDSKRLCFKAQRQDQQYEVAVISIQGQAEGFDVCFLLEKHPAAEDLAWHPDGKKVLVSMTNTQAKNTRHLFVFDPDGDGPPKPLPHQTAEWANLNGAWTPDGKQIVFSSRKVDKM